MAIFFDSHFLMQNFIHLRAYSDYSLLFAANKPKKLVELAVKDKMPALALTDKNNLYGALEFAENALNAGVQPIIGIDLAVKYQNIESSILLLAKNQSGFLNLTELSAIGSKKIPTLEELLDRKEGLIFLSGNILKDAIESKNLNAEDLTKKLLSAFGRDFFIEIQRIDNAKSLQEANLIKLAYKFEIPIVGTNPVLFPQKEFAESHDVLNCIANTEYIGTPNRKRHSKECYFKSQEEMQEVFFDLKEALKNTILIAKRCAFAPIVREPILPKFSCKKTEDEELKDQAQSGLVSKFKKEIPENYQERLDYELGVITKMKYSGYFLIVSDFINWSKDNDIPVGPGRGSGVGSVVAWSLGITGLDPIKFGLLFERFLNPVRVSMPDFDIDFCQEKRGRVIDYVKKKYGHVAQIVTFGSLQPRAALRDVGRVLQFSYNRVDSICKVIPNNPANPITLQEAIDIDKNLQEQRDNDESIAKLFDISLKLEGMLRHASIHAAGIVINDKPIKDYVPIYYEEASEIPITQYSMKYVEKAGLIKFDFLGLKTLTMINAACKLAKQKDPELNIENVALDDQKTFKVLASGRSIGIFQLENAFMSEVLKKLKPDSIDDIIALVSLNRPGPMANIPTYIARKHGKENVEYPHPLLKKALAETFGIAIYQEQVMEVARLIAGYSLAEADILRRAMGKKIRSEMAMQNEKFINGAILNNIEKQKAQEIFDMVEKFAGYGFNKSHAAAYAYISYQTAFLKAHFPLEFFTSLFNLEINNTDKLATFVQDAKNCGIAILPPDVNKSFYEFKIEGDKIRYALSALKNVGESAAKFIEAQEEFKSIEDFITKIDPKIINKRALEGLIKSGTLDCLEKNRAALFASVEGILKDCDKDQKQISLFDASTTSIIKRDIKKWNFFEKTQNEYEAIGFFLENHPIDAYQKCMQLPEQKTLGVITQVRIRSRRDRKFAVLQFATTKDIQTVICYESDIIEKKQNLFTVGSQVVLNAKKSENGLVCSDIYPLDRFLLAKFNRRVEIRVENQNQIKNLKSCLKKGGNFEVTLIANSDTKKTKILLGNDFSFLLKDLVAIEGITLKKAN